MNGFINILSQILNQVIIKKVKYTYNLPMRIYPLWFTHENFILIILKSNHFPVAMLVISYKGLVRKIRVKHLRLLLSTQSVLYSSTETDDHKYKVLISLQKHVLGNQIYIITYSY